jgi:DNA-directed RNA polymerase specialized sigma subunit
MVLADIAARDGDAAAVVDLLEATRRFHASVGDDFEVAVNFRIKPWIEQALRDAATGNLAAVRAYQFAR